MTIGYICLLICMLLPIFWAQKIGKSMQINKQIYPMVISLSSFYISLNDYIISIDNYIVL